MSFWDAYEQSRDATTGMLKQARVGGALARGDTEGAAREAYRLGDYQAGSQIEAMSAQRGEVARKKALGGQIASGDVAGARKAALEAGDFDTANDVQKIITSMSQADKAALAEKTTALGRAAYSLKDIPYAERKGVIVQRLRPALIAEGFSDAEIDAFDPTDANIESTWRSSLELDQLLKMDASAQEAQWRQQDREEDNRRQAERDDDIAEYRRGQLGLGQARVGISAARESRVARKGGGGASGGGKAPWERKW